MTRNKKVASTTDNSADPSSYQNGQPLRPPAAPLQESSLAGQMKPKTLLAIHFPPSNKMTADHHLQPQKSMAYHNMFEDMRYYQSKSHKNVCANSLKSFKELSFADQITNFMLSQQLTCDQLRIRWQVAIDLLHILRQQFSNCDASVFGSLLTDLGGPESDIDICIDFDGDQYKSIEEKAQTERDAIIKDVREKSAELLRKAPSPQFSPAKPFASKVQILGIGRAMSIIRLLQSQTNITMDISFGNRTSVQNSKLLCFYMDLQPRLRQLIVFLRYWGKFHWISGSIRIKQYALALLALVYFMEKEMVPSVLFLQAVADIQRREQGIQTNPDIIGEWDTSFCADRDQIDKYFKVTDSDNIDKADDDKDPERETKLFLDLLTDFFKTVTSTKFHESVVCPLFGAVLPRDKFWKRAETFMEKLPAATSDDFIEWKTNQFAKLKKGSFGRAIVIQDPFVLEFNVGGVCKKWNRDLFLEAAQATLDVLESKPASFLDLLVEPYYPPAPVRRSKARAANKTEQVKKSLQPTTTTAKVANELSKLTLDQNGVVKNSRIDDESATKRETEKKVPGKEKASSSNFLTTFLKNRLYLLDLSTPYSTKDANNAKEQEPTTSTNSSNISTKIRREPSKLPTSNNGESSSAAVKNAVKDFLEKSAAAAAHVKKFNPDDVHKEPVKASKYEESESQRITFEILAETRNRDFALRNTMQESRCSEVISFELDQSFLNTYLAALYRCKILGGGNEPSHHKLKCQMTKLWRDFATNFIETFFTVGLNLTEKNVAIAFSASPMERGKVWKWSRKLNTAKIPKIRTTSVQEAQSKKRALERKCREIGTPSGSVFYEARTVQVGYPFWEGDMLEFNSGDKDPVEQQEKNAARVLSKYNKTLGGAQRFTPFFVDVLVKLDARTNAGGMCGFPSISFVIQNTFEDESQKKKSQRGEHAQAIYSVAKTLRKAFPAYQLYHLSKWLENA